MGNLPVYSTSDVPGKPTHWRRPLYSSQKAYWQATGSLAGDIKVFVVRYRRKYYATNRLSLSATEVRAPYRKRQEVEEVTRGLWSASVSTAGTPGANASDSSSSEDHRA